MSNVQLSCSTLDRLAARRTFPLHARTGVCRNLFGPVDHDELDREMKTKLREISESDQRKWNFNFETHTPVEGGDYVWEAKPMDAIPAFYRDSIQVGRTRITVPVWTRSPLDLHQTISNGRDESSAGQDFSSPSACTAAPESRLAAVESAVNSGDRNQENQSDNFNSGIRTASRAVPCTPRKRTPASATNRQITEFFAKRKRSLETKQSGENGSPSAPVIPTEQTPRKRIR
ncbi:CDN1C inhibitor, partial [Polypterus senegalus]